MFRLCLKPVFYSIGGAARFPLRPLGQANCRELSTHLARTSLNFEKSLVAKATPVSHKSVATCSKDQQDVTTSRSNSLQHSRSLLLLRRRPQQLRSLHTSTPLLARASFQAKVKNRIQKFTQDGNAMQKLMGVGAVGYSVAKVSKLGAVMKFAFPVLKLTKAMPLMSMALSTVCYSCFFGFPFAVGIVSLLFTSQASRALLLKRFGCEVQPMAMIPFFGTMSVGSAETPYTKTEEYVLQNQPFKRCLVTLSPVAGMFLFTAAVPLGVGGLMLDSQCGFAVANTGFMMGMFSLLPLGEMTPGGQLLSYFSRNALLFGTIFNAALIPVFSSPILILCLFLNLYRLYQRGFELFGRQFGGNEEATPNQYAHSLSANVFTDQQKITVASMYWALFLLNAGGMALVGKSLLSPQRLRQQKMEEDRERHMQTDEFPQHYDGRFSSPPASDNSWSVGDWAMNNLNAVEEMDRDEDNDMAWWHEQQLVAERSIPAHERLGR